MTEKFRSWGEAEGGNNLKKESQRRMTKAFVSALLAHVLAFSLAFSESKEKYNLSTEEINEAMENADSEEELKQ